MTESSFSLVNSFPKLQPGGSSLQLPLMVKGACLLSRSKHVFFVVAVYIIRRRAR